MKLLFCSRCGWKDVSCFGLIPQRSSAPDPVPEPARPESPGEGEESGNAEYDWALVETVLAGRGRKTRSDPRANTSFRGDPYRSRCRACEGFCPTRGTVYAVFLDGELVYVGQTTTTIELRHERAWFEAFDPATDGYTMRLSAAMRECPDRSRWEVIALQEGPAGHIELLETAWMVKCAPPGSARPRLNARFSLLANLPMWSEHGGKLVLHFDNIPKLPRKVLSEIAAHDPEAFKRVFRYIPNQ